MPAVGRPVVWSRAFVLLTTYLLYTLVSSVRVAAELAGLMVDIAKSPRLRDSSG
jgi:hypothetical protein